MDTVSGRVADATGLSQQAAEPVVSALTGFDPSRLDFPLLLEVYRAGVRRGSEEATSFDWGEHPSGKWEDELVEALYYHLNGNTKWGEPGYLDWNAIESIVANAIATEARRAETVKLGSAHEGAAPKGQTPNNSSSQDTER
jgi:hypothetical protein